MGDAVLLFDQEIWSRRSEVEKTGGLFLTTASHRISTWTRVHREWFAELVDAS